MLSYSGGNSGSGKGGDLQTKRQGREYALALLRPGCGPPPASERSAMPARHGISRTGILSRTRATQPEASHNVSRPRTVIKDKFLHILRFIQASEKEMLQNGIVQHDYARPLQSTQVD